HSSIRAGVLVRLRRLHATIGAMLSLTFGDTEQMLSAAAGINAIHDRVNGRIGQGAYSAHDPDLQRWVHVTLIDSIQKAYELLVGPLTPAEKDRYSAEAAIMEPLLGLPEGWLPRNSGALADALGDMLSSGKLAVSDTSRTVARAV